jgi:hypothetical protein
MTHDEKLEALRMELARQDQALDDAREQLEAFTDIPVEVIGPLCRDLEDACAPQGMVPTTLVIGIRG